MTNTWFTSDTHFNHLACAISHRKFSSIEEHNEKLIENWNSVVGKNDDVYHLGDFSFGNKDAALKILDNLKGRIYLIRGNHDKVIDNKEVSSQFQWIKDYHEFPTKRFGVPLVLSHYCFKVWNRSHYGAYHFHGHSHGSLTPDLSSLSIDVGVDCWDFKPVDFDRIDLILKARNWKPVDHHTKELER